MLEYVGKVMIHIHARPQILVKQPRKPKLLLARTAIAGLSCLSGGPNGLPYGT